MNKDIENIRQEIFDKINEIYSIIDRNFDGPNFRVLNAVTNNYLNAVKDEFNYISYD